MPRTRSSTRQRPHSSGPSSQSSVSPSPQPAQSNHQVAKTSSAAMHTGPSFSPHPQPARSIPPRASSFSSSASLPVPPAADRPPSLFDNKYERSVDKMLLEEASRSISSVNALMDTLVFGEGGLGSAAPSSSSPLSSRSTSRKRRDEANELIVEGKGSSTCRRSSALHRDGERELSLDPYCARGRETQQGVGAALGGDRYEESEREEIERRGRSSTGSQSAFVRFTLAMSAPLPKNGGAASNTNGEKNDREKDEEGERRGRRYDSEGQQATEKVRDGNEVVNSGDDGVSDNEEEQEEDFPAQTRAVLNRIVNGEALITLFSKITSAFSRRGREGQGHQHHVISSEGRREQRRQLDAGVEEALSHYGAEGAKSTQRRGDLDERSSASTTPNKRRTTKVENREEKATGILKSTFETRLYASKYTNDRKDSSFSPSLARSLSMQDGRGGGIIDVMSSSSRGRDDGAERRGKRRHRSQHNITEPSVTPSMLKRGSSYSDYSSSGDRHPDGEVEDGDDEEEEEDYEEEAEEEEEKMSELDTKGKSIEKKKLEETETRGPLLRTTLSDQKEQQQQDDDGHCSVGRTQTTSTTTRLGSLPLASSASARFSTSPAPHSPYHPSEHQNIIYPPPSSSSKKKKKKPLRPNNNDVGSAAEKDGNKGERRSTVEIQSLHNDTPKNRRTYGLTKEEEKEEKGRVMSGREGGGVEEERLLSPLHEEGGDESQQKEGRGEEERRARGEMKRPFVVKMGPIDESNSVDFCLHQRSSSSSKKGPTEEEEEKRTQRGQTKRRDEARGSSSSSSGHGMAAAAAERFSDRSVGQQVAILTALSGGVEGATAASAAARAQKSSFATENGVNPRPLGDNRSPSTPMAPLIPTHVGANPHPIATATQAPSLVQNRVTQIIFLAVRFIGFTFVQVFHFVHISVIGTVTWLAVLANPYFFWFASGTAIYILSHILVAVPINRFLRRHCFRLTLHLPQQQANNNVRRDAANGGGGGANTNNNNEERANAPPAAERGNNGAMNFEEEAVDVLLDRLPAALLWISHVLLQEHLSTVRTVGISVSSVPTYLFSLLKKQFEQRGAEEKRYPKTDRRDKSASTKSEPEPQPRGSSKSSRPSSGGGTRQHNRKHDIDGSFEGKREGEREREEEYSLPSAIKPLVESVDRATRSVFYSRHEVSRAHPQLMADLFSSSSSVHVNAGFEDTDRKGRVESILDDIVLVPAVSSSSSFRPKPKKIKRKDHLPRISEKEKRQRKQNNSSSSSSVSTFSKPLTNVKTRFPLNIVRYGISLLLYTAEQGVGVALGGLAALGFLNSSSSSSAAMIGEINGTSSSSASLSSAFTVGWGGAGGVRSLIMGGGGGGGGLGVNLSSSASPLLSSGGDQPSDPTAAFRSMVTNPVMSWQLDAWHIALSIETMISIVTRTMITFLNEWEAIPKQRRVIGGLSMIFIYFVVILCGWDLFWFSTSEIALLFPMRNGWELDGADPSHTFTSSSYGVAEKESGGGSGGGIWIREVKNSRTALSFSAVINDMYPPLSLAPMMLFVLRALSLYRFLGLFSAFIRLVYRSWLREYSNNWRLFRVLRRPMMIRAWELYFKRWREGGVDGILLDKTTKQQPSSSSKRSRMNSNNDNYHNMSPTPTPAADPLSSLPLGTRITVFSVIHAVMVRFPLAILKNLFFRPLFGALFSISWWRSLRCYQFVPRVIVLLFIVYHALAQPHLSVFKSWGALLGFSNTELNIGGVRPVLQVVGGDASATVSSPDMSGTSGSFSSAAGPADTGFPSGQHIMATLLSPLFIFASMVYPTDPSTSSYFSPRTSSAAASSPLPPVVDWDAFAEYRVQSFPIFAIFLYLSAIFIAFIDVCEHMYAAQPMTTVLLGDSRERELIVGDILNDGGPTAVLAMYAVRSQFLSKITSEISDALNASLREVHADENINTAGPARDAERDGTSNQQNQNIRRGIGAAEMRRVLRALTSYTSSIHALYASNDPVLRLILRYTSPFSLIVTAYIWIRRAFFSSSAGRKVLLISGEPILFDDRAVLKKNTCKTSASSLPKNKNNTPAAAAATVCSPIGLVEVPDPESVRPATLASVSPDSIVRKNSKASRSSSPKTAPRSQSLLSASTATYGGVNDDDDSSHNHNNERTHSNDHHHGASTVGALECTICCEEICPLPASVYLRTLKPHRPPTTAELRGIGVRLLPCGHVFHQACILPWFESHRTCVLCRAIVVFNRTLLGKALQCVGVYGRAYAYNMTDAMGNVINSHGGEGGGGGDWAFTAVVVSSDGDEAFSATGISLHSDELLPDDGGGGGHQIRRRGSGEGGALRFDFVVATDANPFSSTSASTQMVDNPPLPLETFAAPQNAAILSQQQQQRRTHSHLHLLPHHQHHHSFYRPDDVREAVRRTSERRDSNPQSFEEFISTVTLSTSTVTSDTSMAHQSSKNPTMPQTSSVNGLAAPAGDVSGASADSSSSSQAHAAKRRVEKSMAVAILGSKRSRSPPSVGSAAAVEAQKKETEKPSDIKLTVEGVAPPVEEKKSGSEMREEGKTKGLLKAKTFEPKGLRRKSVGCKRSRDSEKTSVVPNSGKDEATSKRHTNDNDDNVSDEDRNARASPATGNSISTSRQQHEQAKNINKPSPRKGLRCEEKSSIRDEDTEDS